MQDTAFTWATALPLAIAILALLATLGLSVPAAFAESRALRDAQARGLFLESIRNAAARAAKRRELLRVVKHAVVVTGIAISFTSIPIARAIMLRNACFCALSILMLLNTTLDHLTRRNALRYAADHAAD